MRKQKTGVKSPSRPKKDLIPIDGEKLRRFLWEAGYHSYAEQAAVLGTNEKRLRAALKGASFQQATILRWCGRLGIDPNEIILPSAIIGRSGSRDGENPVVGDWVAVQQLTRWIEATNGIAHRVFRMDHRFMKDDRLGRGKVYDMSVLSGADRDDMQQLLQRHPQVCQKIGPHPNIAQNLTALPDANGRDWWVVDRWVEGETLAAKLATGPVPTTELPSLMRGIAEGLLVLHQHGYLRRELSPRFVILEVGTGRPILTDFELAKLLSAGPTVANKFDWQRFADPYRAPEVTMGSPDIGPEIDVYSWGRILLHAATGELPKAGGEEEAISITKLPKVVRDLAAACVSIDRTGRPQSMEDVLQQINRWK